MNGPDENLQDGAQVQRAGAIASVVLQEIRSELEAALIRLEVLQQEERGAAIGRAAELLRAALIELDNVNNDGAPVTDGPRAAVVDE